MDDPRYEVSALEAGTSRGPPLRRHVGELTITRRNGYPPASKSSALGVLDLYNAHPYRQNDPSWSHDHIRKNPFGILVTPTVTDSLIATHLPLRLDCNQGRLGTLRGHVARANSHVELLHERRPCLAIF